MWMYACVYGGGVGGGALILKQESIYTRISGIVTWRLKVSKYPAINADRKVQVTG